MDKSTTIKGCAKSYMKPTLYFFPQYLCFSIRGILEVVFKKIIFPYYYTGSFSSNENSWKSKVVP